MSLFQEVSKPVTGVKRVAVPQCPQKRCQQLF
jgi:hypothetical protein